MFLRSVSPMTGQRLHEFYADICHILGEGGGESAQWVNASGLTNFDTFYGACKNFLTSDAFIWPPNVTSVSYGFGDPISKPES